MSEISGQTACLGLRTYIEVHVSSLPPTTYELKYQASNIHYLNMIIFFIGANIFGIRTWSKSKLRIYSYSYSYSV